MQIRQRNKEYTEEEIQQVINSKEFVEVEGGYFIVKDKK